MAHESQSLEFDINKPHVDIRPACKRWMVVLELVIAGLLSKQIARRLDIKPKAAKR